VILPVKSSDYELLNFCTLVFQTDVLVISLGYLLTDESWIVNVVYLDNQ